MGQKKYIGQLKSQASKFSPTSFILLHRRDEPLKNGKIGGVVVGPNVAQKSAQALAQKSAQEAEPGGVFFSRLASTGKRDPPL